MPKRACAGEWRGAGAGGSPQHATFFANQQFRLKLSGLQQDFRVTLTQAPLGATPKGGEHACHEMGVVVLVAPDARVTCLGARRARVTRLARDDRDVSPRRRAGRRGEGSQDAGEG